MPIGLERRLSARANGMVGATGIEPVTPWMSTKCSTAELRARPVPSYRLRAIEASRCPTASRRGGGQKAMLRCSGALRSPSLLPWLSRAPSFAVPRLAPPPSPTTDLRNGPIPPHPRPGLRGVRRHWTQSQRQSHDRRHHRRTLQPARPAQGRTRRRRHRRDREPARDRSRRPGASAGRYPLPLPGSPGRRRREASRRRRLRRRCRDPLGRPGVARCAGLRSDEADGGRTEAAVRLQQRLSRLSADAGRGQSVTPRPAGRESRIHQRGADVSGHRRRPDDQGAELRQDHQGARGHRDGRPWRRGDRDQAGQWQVAGGGRLEIRPPHRHRHRRWTSPARPPVTTG